MKEEKHLEMNFEVLKRQIGKNILNSLDSFEEKGKLAVLKHGNRKAIIGLNALDYYDLKLVKDHYPQSIEDVPFQRLREILNKFFCFSLKQAIDNGDQERIKEIRKKVSKGETVRVL